MSDDQFTKLFKYMEKRFDAVDKRFDMQDEQMKELRINIAEVGGQLRDYHQEMIMLARKVDRMERWIHELAKQTGIKLSEA